MDDVRKHPPVLDSVVPSLKRWNNKNDDDGGEACIRSLGAMFWTKAQNGIDYVKGRQKEWGNNGLLNGCNGIAKWLREVQKGNKHGYENIRKSW